MLSRDVRTNISFGAASTLSPTPMKICREGSERSTQYARCPPPVVYANRLPLAFRATSFDSVGFEGVYRQLPVGVSKTACVFFVPAARRCPFAENATV